MKIIYVVTTILFLFSCDKNFKALNTNPNAYTEPVIGSLFSANIINTAGNHGNSNHGNDKMTGSFMQFHASLNAMQWSGDKYLYRSLYNDSYFNMSYDTSLKGNAQIIDAVKDNPDLSNHYAIARIWRVYIMHRVTDLYGDVPYSEAALGYLDGIYKPRYDRQSDIYPDMLKELEEASQQLDPNKESFGSADFLYNGDTDKWKRFAYSLMLRLGMRLTKVDPGMAETWVKKAIAGGVMQSNSDLAKLDHTDGNSNNYYWIGNSFQGGEGVPPSSQGRGYAKLNKTFIDHLKETNDPRMPFYATLWEGNADPSKLPITSLPENQKGLPGGYDYSSIRELIPDWNDNMLSEYSEINIHTIASRSTPSIFQSYTEVELLLAEAALRGWKSGEAKQHYEAAVTASMEVETLYPGEMSISTPRIQQYLAENPYISGGFDKQMEQIHTQFWVSVFMNNIEVYANWRRTGYPKLIPTNYPGNETGGTIPRRFRYPQSEQNLNQENYMEAVSVQGPDLFTTRIWWDKQ